MKAIIRVICCGFLLTLLSHIAVAQDKDFGWRPLPDTKLVDACPPNGLYDYDFRDACKNIIYAWNGGDLDPASGRLYIWGGGHNDYYGNELYVLDPRAGSLERLTEPAVPADPRAHPAERELAPYDGTQPNSRHTYDGVAFMQEPGLLWAFSGALAGRSTDLADKNTWLFNPATNGWTRDDSKGDIPNGVYGIVSAYDEATGKVFLHDRSALYSYSYDPDGGRYQRLNSQGSVGLGVNAAIDPVNRRMLILGNKQQILYDLTAESGYRRIPAPLKGDADFINRYEAPGLTYNSKDGHFYAWPGNGQLYRFDMEELSWEGTAFSGDPGPQGRHGTFGRFAYVESIDSFVLVNNPNRDAYLFKLPTVADNQPPTAPTGLAVTHPYPGALSVTWKAGKDNFGVAGYRVFVDGEQVAEQAGTEFKTMAYAPGTRLEVQVQAFDSAGFSSELSNPLTLGLPSQQPKMRLGNCSSEAMLRNRDDIVFCEPWEKHDWWRAGNWLRDPIVDDPRPMTTNTARYTQVTDQGCLSGNCLKVTMEEGRTGALSAYWPLVNANLAPEKLFMRYYMKLSDEWDVNMCKANGEISGAGGKFPGLADVRTWADPGGQCGNGGASGDGINCWSMRLNYRNCDSNDGEACATKPRAAMRLGSYLYFPLQGGSTGSVGHWDEDDWNQSRSATCDTRAGNLFCGKGDGGVLERDQWYQIEMQVEMNTPGKADGVIRGWVDGQLSYEKTNMVFRNEGHDFLHNRLAWFNIYKGGMDGNCSTSHVYLDQMVIALDQPVGGLDSITETPPSLQLEVSLEQPTDEETVTVEWSSEDAHSCRASGLWEGGKALGNRTVIGPFSESGVLQLDCEGPGGKATRRVELLVNGEPITQQSVTDARLSAPKALAIAEQDTEYLTLQWDEAPDAENIVAYRVLVNGEFKDEVTQPRLTVHNLLPGMQLEYRIQAVNSKGYLSPPSKPFVVDIPEDGRNRNSATLYPDSDTYLARSTFKTLGRSRQLAVSANRSVLLKFPVDLLERQRVRSATLVLTPVKQFGHMTVDLYRVAEDWHERSATREYSDQDNRRRWQRELGDWLDKQGNLHGSNAYETAWLRDTGATQKVEIDLTELVNAWLGGETNNGAMLLRKNGSEHFFHSKEAQRPGGWPRLEVKF